MTIFLIGIGGMLGSVLRYLFGTFLSSSLTSSISIPVPTLIINVVGSLFIGVVLGLLGDARPSWFYLIVPGVLGGFTTYSAYAGETMMLFQKGEIGAALSYVALTTIAAVVACASGYFISLGRLF